MKFSVVIPSFNQAPFLPACLESVLSQSAPGAGLEVLVYDGGSTDGSREIIERQAPRLAYWQSRPDGGQAAALKAGFERATGDVLGWVNSDDILLPGALAAAAAAFEANPGAPLIYGDAVWIDGQGRVIRPKREIDFDWGIFAYGYCYIPQPSAFFRRAAYQQAGGLDAELKCCMDSDLWHRLARPGPVVHLPAFMSGLRDHPGTKTNQLKAVFAREHEILRSRYLKCGRTVYNALHVLHRLRRVAKRVLGGCYRPLSAAEAARCGLVLGGGGAEG
jgi:glycosyltransferase involved in cell wall biosynthesis